MASSRATFYGMAVAVAIVAHGAVVALLWHVRAVPQAAPAVLVRLIERAEPAPTRVAASLAPSAEVQPQPPAPAVTRAVRRAARLEPVPAPRPRPALLEQSAPLSASAPQPTTPAAAAAPAPPAVAITPPSEPELAVRCPHRPPPAYPVAARRRGQEGVVQLLVELSASGAVTGVAVARSSGWSTLDDAAVTAVRNWHCEPARVGGGVVPATASQHIHFSLR